MSLKAISVLAKLNIGDRSDLEISAVVLFSLSSLKSSEPFSAGLLGSKNPVGFLKDAINIAKNLPDAFLIIRYKAFKCPLRSNPYFENIVKEISNIENISISNNYDEPFYSYKLCSQANLIIAKHTSIADECLSKDIPVLFYEYTHNMIGIQTDAFNYLSSEFICYNSKELLHKSRSILFDQSNNYKNEISRLKKKIYHVENEGNIKNKIMEHLENMVN